MLSDASYWSFNGTDLLVIGREVPNNHMSASSVKLVAEILEALDQAFESIIENYKVLVHSDPQASRM